MRYVCEVAGAAGAAGDTAGAGCGWGCGRGREAPEGARVSGFAQLPGTLADPALARAYRCVFVLVFGCPCVFVALVGCGTGRAARGGHPTLPGSVSLSGATTRACWRWCGPPQAHTLLGRVWAQLWVRPEPRPLPRAGFMRHAMLAVYIACPSLEGRLCTPPTLC